MDLPTYTNIWRIEKRLYKLYDFRLPMPLPINWIAVFAGITVPYILLLIAIGLPFNHTLVWLYVLPPGVLTWMTTRPVIENKRLPELVESQVRYLTEPRTWVRLQPLSEKNQMILTASIYHGRPRRQAPAPRPAPAAARRALPPGERERQANPLRQGPGPVLKPTSIFRPDPGRPAVQGPPLRQRPGSGVPQRARAQERARGQDRDRGQERFRVRERSKGQVPGQDALRRAPELPPVRLRQAPPSAPVAPVNSAPPERPGPPVHAMPDVLPPVAAWPAPDANLSKQAPQPAPAANSRPAPARSQPAPAPTASPADTPVLAPEPQPAPAPVRARAFGRSGGARLEVSHDGPKRRQPPGQAPGQAPPAKPVQAVPPVQEASQAPVAEPAAQAQSASEAPAAPPVWPNARQTSIRRGPAQPEPAQREPVTPRPPSDPPADSVRGWPVPARPLRPVSTAPDEPLAEPAPAANIPTPAEAPAPAAAPAAAEALASAASPAPAEAPAPAAAPAPVEAHAFADAPAPAQQERPAQPAPADAPEPVDAPARADAAETADAPAVEDALAQPEPQERQAPPTQEEQAAEVAATRPEHSQPAEPAADAAPASPVFSAVTPAEGTPVPDAIASDAPAFEAEPEPVLPEPVALPSAPEPTPAMHVEPFAEPVLPIEQAPLAEAVREAEFLQAPQTEAPAQAPSSAPAPTVQHVADVKLPSIERALSGPARDLTGSWGGKVKVVTGNGATHGPGARDQEAQDRNRARLPIAEPRRILVLGCTSGAGQSVTTLMTASILASLREHPVAAVDLHDGTLARYRAPAAWLEELLAGKPPQQIRPTRPDGLHPTPKPSPARLDVVASHEPLGDGDEIKLAVQLNRHYPLTLLDPGAAGLTRLLKVTDQLLVVVPANVDAAGALADTRDWLDNNGHADLAMQSVTVINGVSRRSLPDVESAEAIARGRSRAIVRVPWDDMLPVAAASPSTLRPQTRVAYTALAGVLVAGLATAPVRKKP